MRTILDAYALIAFLVDEPAAPEVERLLRSRAAITSVNFAEVLDRLVRGRQLPEDAVQAALTPLLDERLERIDVDFPLAATAARLRAEHHHRTQRPLSLADCVCLAAAGPGDAVATADKPMLDTAAAAGIDTVRLPSSAA